MKQEFFKIVVDKPQKELYSRRNEGKICCFWCCHPFDHRPIGMPVRHIKMKERYFLQGVYCSWACVNAANRDQKDFRMVQRSGMIYELARRWHGVSARRTAPPRLALKMFGGTMSIEEFRSPPEKEYVVQTPPVLEIVPDEQLVLAKAFGPVASMPATQTSIPLSDAYIPCGENKPPQYHVNKVTVAERRKRKRVSDLKKMGININKNN